MKQNLLFNFKWLIIKFNFIIKTIMVLTKMKILGIIINIFTDVIAINIRMNYHYYY